MALLPGDRFQDFELHSVDWLLLNDLPLKSAETNYDFINSFEEKVQVSVFLQSEVGSQHDYINKIPYRTGLVEPNSRFSVRLQEGQYDMVVFDKKGDILTERELFIKPG